jgi:hypothetical protein
MKVSKAEKDELRSILRGLERLSIWHRGFDMGLTAKALANIPIHNLLLEKIALDKARHYLEKIVDDSK